MKSLQSDIELNTIISIVVVSVLIIGSSIFVYEKLYLDFVSTEVEAISENLSVDLMGTINVPEAQSKQTELLLRLDEYSYVESAALFDEKNSALSHYVGRAASSEQMQRSNIQSSLSTLSTLNVGTHELDSSVVVIKRIGEADLPLGKFALKFSLQEALNDTRRQFIASVAPLVGVLILIFFIITHRLQRRSLRPLAYLIETMNSVVSEHNYDVEVKTFRKKETAALSNAFNNMMANIRSQTLINKQKTDLLIGQQQEVERLANLDPLTNLPNRQNLMKQLEAMLSKAQNMKSDMALMFLDMDGFKAINDTFGHDIGDRFLQQVSESIKKVIPNESMLGRLGGDEFLIIFEQSYSVVRLTEIANNIIDSVALPYEVDGLRLSASISIGIATASGCSFERSKLITHADVAMYKAKELGKGRCIVFNTEMLAEKQREQYIDSKIVDGLASDAFYVVYQAKVNQATQIVGFEALLRWEDSELGNVPPFEFIPIAEKNDKISLITKWVFEKVCGDIPMIKTLFNDDVVVSINLSPQDIHHIEVTESIMKWLDTQQALRKNIEFEITETAYMNNFEHADGFFTALKEKGANIALDDFGTGYSSLSYLSELVIDTLKIDRQFVSQIGKSRRSEKITSTIIELAKSLDCHVCAEGIETQAQAEFLIERGCHMLQGYLYSRPKPLCVIKQEVEALESIRVGTN